jgi:hypothetical protein
MVTRLLVFLVMAGAAAPRLLAQDPGPARAQELRRQVEQRFLERMRTELQLTQDQDTRVRAILGSYGEKRRMLEQDERRLRQALGQQLRPGIAAQEDSVGVLVDAIAASRVGHAQLIQGELKELGGVLTPIQRGQLFLMRDQLLQRVQEMRDQARLRGPGPGGPPPS